MHAIARHRNYAGAGEKKMTKFANQIAASLFAVVVSTSLFTVVLG